MANIKLAEQFTHVLIDFNVYNLLRSAYYVCLSQSQLNTVHIRKYRANTSFFGQSVMNVYVIPSLRFSLIQSFCWCARQYINQYKHTKVNIQGLTSILHLQFPMQFLVNGQSRFFLNPTMEL